MSFGLRVEILDLEKLIGTYEHIRLDFKSALLFYDIDTGKPKSNYVDSLSKEVSGFANTEGGHIIIGIRTEKCGNEPDRAVGLDEGIAFRDFNPETVQRAVAASISPPLPGLRFIPIRTEKDASRYYLVIEVPRGYTAHQAKDKLYYGRLEFETSPLHDSVIRLLMARAEKPHAIVRLDNVKVKEAGTAAVIGDGHSVSFDMIVENDGEVNINEFKLVARITSTSIGWVSSLYDLSKKLLEEGAVFVYRDGWPAPEGSPYRKGEKDAKPISVNIYPKDCFLIGHYEFVVHPRYRSEDEYRTALMETVIEEIAPRVQDEDRLLEFVGIAKSADFRNDLPLQWALYLPNTPPIEGVIDLMEQVASHLAIGGRKA